MSSSCPYKRIVLIVLAALLLALNACTGVKQVSEADLQKLHSKFLSVDSHEDMHWALLIDSVTDFAERRSSQKPRGFAELKDMKQGCLDAAFIAAYIHQGPLTAKGRDSAIQQAEFKIDAIHRQIDRNANLCELALTPDDAYKIKAAGKAAIFIGLENGYGLGDRLELIRKYYNEGVRYITLCHVKNNDICTSSTDSTGGKGLTEFGKQIVIEMNKTGMMVDVSHISDEAFFDVMKITTKPVIASHSCMRALCDTSRNMSDELLYALKKNGGVAQISFVSEYLKFIPGLAEYERESAQLAKKATEFAEMHKKDPTIPLMIDLFASEHVALLYKYPSVHKTISDMVDHIDHVVKTIGVDYVGIGSDFNGGGFLNDCRGQTDMKYITAELIRRGYNEEEIAKIWGGNIMRVMREVQKTDN